MAGYVPNSKSVHWCTPLKVVKQVHEVFGGPPDLDPCSNADSVVGAQTQLTEGGLEHDWTQYRSVFVNPPYGRKMIDPWVVKAAQTGQAGSEVLLLIPASVDTKYFQEHATTADALVFFRGRLKFRGGQAGAPFRSCIAYWGEDSGRFARVFRPTGWLIHDGSVEAATDHSPVAKLLASAIRRLDFLPDFDLRLRN